MIICGDCLVELKKLESESVDCCITSPPYWGLRDYGTAQWEGGRESCNHRIENSIKDKTSSWIRPSGIEAEKANNVMTLLKYNECPYCGARRVDNQLGLERTPEEYVSKMVDVFREVKRVLKKEGTLWLNLGDSYSGGSVKTKEGKLQQRGNQWSNNPLLETSKNNTGIKPKDLIGIPWRVAFALQADGWYLRQDIIWAKPNPMPESVTDRCTKAHEYIFLLAKSEKYYFDNEAIKDFAKDDESYEGREFRGRYAIYEWGAVPGVYVVPRPKDKDVVKKYEKVNKRSVWMVPPKPLFGSHFAVFPEALIKPCVLAGCPKGGVVLDPFFGSGTTGVVAKKNYREFIGIELNPRYVEIARRRLQKTRVVQVMW